MRCVYGLFVCMRVGKHANSMLRLRHKHTHTFTHARTHIHARTRIYTQYTRAQANLCRSRLLSRQSNLKDAGVFGHKDGECLLSFMHTSALPLNGRKAENSTHAPAAVLSPSHKDHSHKTPLTRSITSSLLILRQQWATGC